MYNMMCFHIFIHPCHYHLDQGTECFQQSKDSFMPISHLSLLFGSLDFQRYFHFFFLSLLFFKLLCCFVFLSSYFPLRRAVLISFH